MELALHLISQSHWHCSFRINDFLPFRANRLNWHSGKISLWANALYELGDLLCLDIDLPAASRNALFS